MGNQDDHWVDAFEAGTRHYQSLAGLRDIINRSAFLHFMPSYIENYFVRFQQAYGLLHLIQTSIYFAVAFLSLSPSPVYLQGWRFVNCCLATVYLEGSRFVNFFIWPQSTSNASCLWLSCLATVYLQNSRFVTVYDSFQSTYKTTCVWLFVRPQSTHRAAVTFSVCLQPTNEAICVCLTFSG